MIVQNQCYYLWSNFSLQAPVTGFSVVKRRERLGNEVLKVKVLQTAPKLRGLGEHTHPTPTHK